MAIRSAGNARLKPFRALTWLGLSCVMLLAACGAVSRSRVGGSGATAGGGPAAVNAKSAGQAGGAPVPRPARIVVVVMENRSFSEIIDGSQAPFLRSLAGSGALFTDSAAVTHPSEPNYLALFSGSTQGITGDQCPLSFSGPNLAAQLISAGLSFTGYAEGLPGSGSPACAAGEYARKHAPWTDFGDVPGSASRPFSDFPAGQYSGLPTVSFVIPDLCHDMHDCSVAAGDAWLRANLGGYATWAMTHSSLLIVTWDKDDGSGSNQIATIFAGQGVRPGRYSVPITHYTVLRTIEQACGLPPVGQAARTPPITAIWRR